MRVILGAVSVLAGCVALSGPEQTTGAGMDMRSGAGFSARADYVALCADCHGAGGRGDGPAAAQLSPRPADLTRLAARSGGTFPTTRVMAKVWGYAGGKGSGVMPAFAPLMEGVLIPYDGGDGIDTPTPERLVALAEYVKALQK